jgi:hypothetical protein
VGSAPKVRSLLDRAAVVRGEGQGGASARLFDEAVALARADGDLGLWTEAVLGAASVYLFGAEPGRLPAQLYDVLARTTDEATRARLCAALARCWAYAGHPSRATKFAGEAVTLADRVADPELLADCLDASLAAHWGPDELVARRALAERLDDVAAHVLDPEARLRAALWGLQVACESLEVPTIHRQLRALDRLGEESARALFFATTRRLMLNLLQGRTDAAARLIEEAEAAADRSALPDAHVVVRALHAYCAAFSSDTKACLASAAEAEAFARAEGVTVVAAEAAFLWTCGGDRANARRLLQSFDGGVLDELPRDVNWLLTLQCVLETALFVGHPELVAAAAAKLAGYEGRAVFNAGAVMFHGLTDDTLARAALVAGDPESAARLCAQALAAYERLGAKWWAARLTAWQEQAPAAQPDAATTEVVWRAHLRPVPGGAWVVGPEPLTVPLAGLRGFGYLRALLSRPGLAVAALDLVGAGQGTVLASGLGEVVDRSALAAYRQRLRDLDDELADADARSDQGRSQLLYEERAALLAEVARATGLGGRSRTTGSSEERARVAVRKAITVAIDRVGTVDPALSRHLRASVRTGLTCSYDPDPDAPVEWVLS